MEPFEIFELDGFTGGKLGICKMPNLDVDFKHIHAWKPDVIISMTPKEEFPNSQFSTHISDVCTDWHHCPIPDYGTPTADISDFVQSLKIDLNAGKRILAHCMGGNGRSGMMVMKLLVAQGENPQTALARIRATRPHAVETPAQEIWASKPL